MADTQAEVQEIKEIGSEAAFRDSRSFLGSDAAQELRSAGRDVLGREAGHVVRPEDRKEIVTEWTGPKDWANCPPSYEAWWDQYRDETYFWVRRAGVNFREVDDVVGEIMTRFMERDSLGVFDRNWSTRSATGKSRFQSYYSNFVVGYASGKHRNNVRYIKKHAYILDAPVGEDGATWYDVNAPSYSDNVEATVLFADVVASVRARIGDDELVDAVLILAADGDVKQNGLRSALGCNARAAKTGLEAVRAALRDALAEGSA